MTENGRRDLRDETSHEGAPDPDTVFSLLSNSRRRHLLYLLAEDGTPQPVELLATRIADMEATETDTEDVYLSLVHAHLPKLETHQVVSCDGETVEPRSAMADVEPFLDVVQNYELDA